MVGLMKNRGIPTGEGRHGMPSGSDRNSEWLNKESCVILIGLTGCITMTTITFYLIYLQVDEIEKNLALFMRLRQTVTKRQV